MEQGASPDLLFKVRGSSLAHVRPCADVLGLEMLTHMGDAASYGAYVQLMARSHSQSQKPKKHRPKPLVKAKPPINKQRTKAAASQEVDYFAVTPNGKQSKGHVVGLSETFIPGPHPDADICSPSCTTKRPDLILAGEFEDQQFVKVGESYSVERRWTVDGLPAQVLDPNGKPFDYEILHQSTETNPPFQIEYKNDPSQ